MCEPKTNTFLRHTGYQCSLFLDLTFTNEEPLKGPTYFEVIVHMWHLSFGSLVEI